jgi:Ala-tRNA(Pro) deacylase
MSIVSETLKERGVAFEEIEHLPAWTALDEAKTMKVGLEEVLKSVIVDTHEGQILVVTPGNRQLDMRKLRDVIADPHAQLADEEEIRHSLPEFELGAIPPLGSLCHMPTYVDHSVLEHRHAYIPDGTQTRAVHVRVEDLYRDEAMVVSHFTRDADEIC